MKHFVITFILSLAMITPVFANDGDVDLTTVPTAFQGDYYCAAVSENCGISWENHNWRDSEAVLVIGEDRFVTHDGTQGIFTRIIKRYHTAAKAEQVILFRDDDIAYVISKLSNKELGFIIQVYSISQDMEKMRLMMARKTR